MSKIIDYLFIGLFIADLLLLGWAATGQLFWSSHPTEFVLLYGYAFVYLLLPVVVFYLLYTVARLGESGRELFAETTYRWSLALFGVVVVLNTGFSLMQRLV